MGSLGPAPLCWLSLHLCLNPFHPCLLLPWGCAAQWSVHTKISSQIPFSRESGLRHTPNLFTFLFPVSLYAISSPCAHLLPSPTIIAILPGTWLPLTESVIWPLQAYVISSYWKEKPLVVCLNCPKARISFCHGLYLLSYVYWRLGFMKTEIVRYQFRVSCHVTSPIWGPPINELDPTGPCGLKLPFLSHPPQPTLQPEQSGGRLLKFPSHFKVLSLSLLLPKHDFFFTPRNSFMSFN